MRAILVLEDGTNFIGESFGITGEATGLLILNTGVVGYQEIMTDPANAGKILVLTYPLIGNCGINEEFNESERVWINGLVIKEASSVYSNWQAKSSLEEFLKKENVTGITGIDTRTLAVKIRNDGEMMGIISTENYSIEELLKRLNELKGKRKKSMLSEISTKEIKIFEGEKERILIIDLGILKSILRQLSSLGLEVILVPYDTSAKEILKLKPKGIIISNGPEEDSEISKVIDTTKEILGEIPLLGISTGHQITAIAMGAKVTKMKVGHHGLNYPVKNLDSPKGEITVQNHSFVVDEDSLDKKDVQILERNINDNTIEKIKSVRFKFISIQYYPVSPGLGEIHPVFREFVEIMEKKPDPSSMGAPRNQ